MLEPEAECSDRVGDAFLFDVGVEGVDGRADPGMADCFA
jgi:hypothetical protein